MSFTVLLGASLFADGSTYDVTNRLLQSGVVACCIAGAAAIVLPVISAAYRTVVVAPSRKTRSVMLSRNRKRLEARQEAQRREDEARRQAELERTRPERERAQHEAEKRAAQERERKLNEQRRREVARFKVKLLFDRHCADIKSSLPRKRFDDYLIGELSDQFPADEVERRAAALEAMILDFFERAEEPRPVRTLEDTRNLFFEERRRIEQSDFDADTKDSLLADINLAEDKAIRELRQQ